MKNPPSGMAAIPEADENIPVTGAQVWAGGYPAKANERFIPFSTLGVEAGRDLILHDTTPPGYSGGPVIRDGAVVGMIHGEGPAGGQAMVSASLRSFLTNNHVPWGPRLSAKVRPIDKTYILNPSVTPSPSGRSISSFRLPPVDTVSILNRYTKGPNNSELISIGLFACAKSSQNISCYFAVTRKTGGSMDIPANCFV